MPFRGPSGIKCAVGKVIFLPGPGSQGSIPLLAATISTKPNLFIRARSRRVSSCLLMWKRVMPSRLLFEFCFFSDTFQG